MALHRYRCDHLECSRGLAQKCLASRAHAMSLGLVIWQIENGGSAKTGGRIATVGRWGGRCGSQSTRDG
jgi:hypothetical protein